MQADGKDEGFAFIIERKLRLYYYRAEGDEAVHRVMGDEADDGVIGNERVAVLNFDCG